MAISRHNIRVYISSGYVDLRVECTSSTDAECKIDGGDGGTVCRYVQWWKEAEAAIEEFYSGEEGLVLRDGAEIDIDWDGEVWVWELLNG